MSDIVTEAGEHSTKAFDYVLGAGGVSSLWWLPWLHSVNEIAGTIAAVGGAVLVLRRLFRDIKRGG